MKYKGTVIRLRTAMLINVFRNKFHCCKTIIFAAICIVIWEGGTSRANAVNIQQAKKNIYSLRLEGHYRLQRLKVALQTKHTASTEKFLANSENDLLWLVSLKSILDSHEQEILSKSLLQLTELLCTEETALISSKGSLKFGDVPEFQNFRQGKSRAFVGLDLVPGMKLNKP